jgi:hypothetical protein
MPRRGHEARHGQRVHGNHHCDDRYNSGNHHNRAGNGDHQMTDAVSIEVIKAVPSTIGAVVALVIAFLQLRTLTKIGSVQSKVDKVEVNTDGLQAELMLLQGAASYGKGQMAERQNERDFLQKEKENLNDSTKT